MFHDVSLIYDQIAGFPFLKPGGESTTPPGNVLNLHRD